MVLFSFAILLFILCLIDLPINGSWVLKLPITTVLKFFHRVYGCTNG